MGKRWSPPKPKPHFAHIVTRDRWRMWVLNGGPKKKPATVLAGRASREETPKKGRPLDR